MQSMDRRRFLAYGGMGLPASLSNSPPETALPTRPNIIWIFGDQHRAQAMSCNGDPNLNTPHLDTLAAQGVNFTGALSGFPLCCPFRGSLLTGRYPHHCVPGHEYPLPKGQPTLARVFNEAGYHTAYFGKWHLSGWHESDGRGAMHVTAPDRRGEFQTWAGYENNNSQYDCWVHGGEGQGAFHHRLPGYETDELTNLLIGYLQDRASEKKSGRERPFFAALSVQPPHNPYVAPPDWMARHNPEQLRLRPNVPLVRSIQERCRRELAGYYGMIENLDWNVGRIRQALDRMGMSFQTHIVFFSDHGDMHGSQGQFLKMTPYEESIRIPFLIGGMQPHGYDGLGSGRYPVLLNHVDIAPTTLGLCGLPKPEWMEGYDYSHFRLGKKSKGNEPDSAYLQSVIPTRHGDSVDKPTRGLITRDGWKYICFEGVSFLMFNLNEDPYEQVNLAHNPKYLAERRRLLDRLKQWISDTGDTFRLPEP